MLTRPKCTPRGIRAALRFGWLRHKDRTEHKRGRNQETAPAYDEDVTKGKSPLAGSGISGSCGRLVDVRDVAQRYMDTVDRPERVPRPDPYTPHR
jgi:hypothetical protein